MILVLLIVRMWPMVKRCARKFADLVQRSDIYVLFLSNTIAPNTREAGAHSSLTQ
jgi:hypothetical protein